MLIQPIKPVFIHIKSGNETFNGLVLSLTDTDLEFSSLHYLEKNSQIFFNAEFFRGTAIVEKLDFHSPIFKYTLRIENINFQPGLLVNTRL